MRKIAGYLSVLLFVLETAPFKVIDMQTREVVKGIPTGDKAAQIINTYTNLFEVPGVYKTGHMP